MKVRSRDFLLTGALGGFFGFLLMELLRFLTHRGDGQTAGVFELGLQFTGFGLGLGAMLGLTEGWVTSHRRRLVNGLIFGLLLGAFSGFCGGSIGQFVFGLVPLRYAGSSSADLVVLLDSSGSMRQFVIFGNDPWGKRKKATKNLIDRLSKYNRIAIVGFDNRAELLCPLTFLDSAASRRAAKAAVERVDASGGTNLDVGLVLAMDELERSGIEGRDQHVILLTDGVGDYDPETVRKVERRGIRIHTVGLGRGVDALLLSRMAKKTQGRYYPVADASDLIAVFDQIFVENFDMSESGLPEQETELVTSPWVLFAVRILSWAVLGMMIGLGQGVRKNTWEDLRACALGGGIGGAMGGGLFDPLSHVVSLGTGLLGRGIGGVIVGAFIGASMRLVQQRWVEASGQPTTALMKTAAVSITPSQRPDRVQQRRASTELESGFEEDRCL